MYSRRFSNDSGSEKRTIDPPPDYGGVAYRAYNSNENQSEAERAQEVRRGYSPYYESDREEQHGKEKENDPPYEEEARCARRPLYSENRPERRRQEKKEKSQSSSFFSFGGRGFSLEDIILAGMILLLLGDKGEGREPDGELLLILGLLLFSK